MPFEKGHKKSIGNHGGRKTIAEEFNLVKAINAYAPKFWKKLERMIDEDAPKEDIKFALQEFNKVQLKRMPSVVEGNPDKPLGIIMLPLKQDGDSMETKSETSDSIS